eukprot:1074069-Rhodomonas_salina.2
MGPTRANRSSSTLNVTCLAFSMRDRWSPGGICSTERRLWNLFGRPWVSGTVCPSARASSSSLAAICTSPHRWNSEAKLSIFGRAGSRAWRALIWLGGLCVDDQVERGVHALALAALADFVNVGAVPRFFGVLLEVLEREVKRDLDCDHFGAVAQAHADGGDVLAAQLQVFFGLLVVRGAAPRGVEDDDVLVQAAAYLQVVCVVHVDVAEEPEDSEVVPQVVAAGAIHLDGVDADAWVRSAQGAGERDGVAADARRRVCDAQRLVARARVQDQLHELL